jgi:hypothetical protein
MHLKRYDICINQALPEIKEELSDKLAEDRNFKGYIEFLNKNKSS